MAPPSPLAAKFKKRTRERPITTNIYGPNQDNPEFYRNLNRYIDEMHSDFLIICGDMNLVQDYPNDCYNYRHRNNPRATEILHDIKDQYSLVDPWKILHPDQKGYT